MLRHHYLLPLHHGDSSKMHELTAVYTTPDGAFPCTLPKNAGPRGRHPLNCAYYCNKCGDVWGWLTIQGQNSWHPQPRLCEHHGSGLLQLSIDDQAIYRWPTSLLTRELRIINNLIEKEGLDNWDYNKFFHAIYTL